MFLNYSIRIGYVVKRYPRYSETFIVNEILAHEAAGMEIEIFSLYPPNDTHFQNTISMVRAPVTYLSVAGKKFSGFWWGLEEAAKNVPGLWSALEYAVSEEPQVVYQAAQLASEVCRKGIQHLHAHFGSVATSVVRLAAIFANISYSFTAHAKDIYHESVNDEDLYRKLDQADAVITVSDFNENYLRMKFREAAKGVVRIYNGLDLKSFPYQSPEDRPARIVAVGRMVEKKGFGDLIDACAILAHNGVQFECLIIGSGELEVELNRRIEELGVQRFVKLPGPRPQKELVQIVRDAAVFAAPCVIGEDGNRDGLPTVLLESMALGTPCVSTDVTGIPEVIRDGQTGLMVPQHSPEALAAAFQKLLSDPSLRCQLAAGARRLIEDEFDIHKNSTRMREVFRTVLAGHSATSKEEVA
ncbi:MAG: glycosyltransferase [Calditrichia bacterium]